MHNERCKYELKYGTCKKQNCAYKHLNKKNRESNQESNNSQNNQNRNKSKDKIILLEKIGNLQKVKTIEYHKKDIENILSFTNFKNSYYLTSDCEKFNLFDQNDESLYESSKKINIRLGKIIISSDGEKIIFVEINEENKTNIIKVLFNINNESSCIFNTKFKPINIFESSNFIIVIEENNTIEILEFDPKNNILIKKYDNATNANEAITSIEGGKDFLFCGHQNGLISVWKTKISDPYLESVKNCRIHYGSINKILVEEKEDNKIILITCSSDKTLKVHVFENGDRICTELIHFEDEVVDAKKVQNFEKKLNLIVSLKNGVLKVFNSEFKEIFAIPNRLNIKVPRYVLGLKNNEDDSKGDFLYVTEGKNIEKFCWIKSKNNQKIEDEK
jgi:hypothetical protein